MGRAKVSTIQKELIAHYRSPAQTTCPTNALTHVPFKFPEFHHPTKAQLWEMFPAVQRQNIQVCFGQSWLVHKPHDHTKPDIQSKFMTQDGMGCDTSWHNKNKNRAVVTFLTAVDQAGHMTPDICSALLPTNIKTETLVEHFEATKAKVKKCVQEIVNDPSSIAHKTGEDQTELLRLSNWILKNGWQVPKWMIDKCRAELKALKIAFHDAYICICQFHIVQAILQWDCEDKMRGGVH
ncbi:hypothetical protein K439DRAFT_1623151 [Ramaria rubella]|nr:hypothetical protein K439DRAFT_1623151 [Ramaria rubella]